MRKRNEDSPGANAPGAVVRGLGSARMRGEPDEGNQGGQEVGCEREGMI